MQNKIEIKIPEIDIQNFIAEAVAEKLGDKKALVKAFVDAALSEKTSSYDKDTVFVKKVKNMVSEAAKEIFKQWLEKHKNIIKKAVEKRLKMEKSEFIEKIADQIVNGLAKSFYVSCNMKIED